MVKFLEERFSIDDGCPRDADDDSMRARRERLQEVTER
jgi:hypothetical protein